MVVRQTDASLQPRSESIPAQQKVALSFKFKEEINLLQILLSFYLYLLFFRTIHTDATSIFSFLFLLTYVYKKPANDRTIEATTIDVGKKKNRNQTDTDSCNQAINHHSHVSPWAFVLARASASETAIANIICSSKLSGRSWFAAMLTPSGNDTAVAPASTMTSELA